VCLAADSLTDDDLRRAYDYCLTPEARAMARDCAAAAKAKLGTLREEFLTNIDPAS
jgi:hypothetical protein